MPGRVGHLPNHFEREALQKLLVTGELPTTKIAAHRTLKRMLDKGWIECGISSSTYRITPTGNAALKAKLPSDYNRRQR